MEENEYWNMDFPLDPWLEGYFVGWEECMYDGEYEYYEESSYYWDGESESEEFSSYDGEDYGETPLWKKFIIYNLIIYSIFFYK